ncbi:MFS transporter [Ligilactobacillus faecis]|uniref:MFS transporter n=1 Tax=Ligilactobacillus faecis TaxID=762833 RepID=A0ABV4DUA1_9LACO|nr:MFS transporter [Ligilactobacillus faecis]WGN90485.1 MFS transporter [Ligilactobacillus faecis]
MQQRKLFFMLVASFNLAANYAHPITPTYFKLLGLDSAMFGYAFALMSLGMFVASPLFGKLSNKYASKTLMGLGSLGYSLAQVIFAVAHSPSLILGGRFFAGFSCASFFVGALAYITNTTTAKTRGADLTLNAAIQTVFSALGYFVGGLVGDYDLMLAFGLQIGQLFLTGILFYFCLQNDLKVSDTVSSKKTSAQTKRRPALAPLVWGLLAVSALTFLGYTSFDQSFNYYLKDIFDLSTSYNGTFKGAVGLISLGANLTLGLYLVKKPHLKQNTSLILVLCAVFMGCVCLTYDLKWFFLANLIFYGLYAISVPLVQELITNQATKDNQGQILGAYQASQSFGRIFGAFLAGILYDQAPLSPFILGASSFLLAAILVIILPLSKKKPV